MIAYYELNYELNNTQSYLFADYVSITESRNFLYGARGAGALPIGRVVPRHGWGGRDLRARHEDLFGGVEIFY